jgi:predicted kinase
VPTPTLILITGLPGSGKSSLAQEVADELGCAVLGHDWTMTGLRSFPSVWREMQSLGSDGFRSVGWTVMWNLARAQLRQGRSVVLDGVARAGEAQGTRTVAQEERSRCLVVLSTLDDATLHRQRVEGRDRGIPGWPELTWESVAQGRKTFEPPGDVDLVLDAAQPFADNAGRLRALVRSAPSPR